MLRTAINKSRLVGARGIWAQGRQLQAFSSSATHLDLDGEISLQAARTWDEGVKSKFATTPLKDIFKVLVEDVPLPFTMCILNSRVYPDEFESLGFGLSDNNFGDMVRSDRAGFRYASWKLGL